MEGEGTELGSTIPKIAAWPQPLLIHLEGLGHSRTKKLHYKIRIFYVSFGIFNLEGMRRETAPNTVGTAVLE